MLKPCIDRRSVHAPLDTDNVSTSSPPSASLALAFLDHNAIVQRSGEPITIPNSNPMDPSVAHLNDIQLHDSLAPPAAFNPLRPPHRCEWRHGLAVDHEAKHGPLANPASTGGVGLVTAPNSPTLQLNPPSPDEFATLLRKALEQLCWLQDLRRKLYGSDAAEAYPPGHTPPTLKARCVPTAENVDDGTTTEEDAPCIDTRIYMPTTHRKRLLDTERFTAGLAGVKRKCDDDKDSKSTEVGKVRPMKRRIGSARSHPTQY